MKRRFAAAIAVASALIGAAASAATPIDRRIDAQAGDRLAVYNVSGSITVTGGNGNEVHLTGSLGNNVERLDFERDGDRIVVRVVLEEDSQSREGTTLDIAAPRGIDIDVDAVSAEIVVRAIEGEQRLSSVSGQITNGGVRRGLVGALGERRCANRRPRSGDSYPRQLRERSDHVAQRRRRGQRANG